MSDEMMKMPEPVAWWTDRKIGQKANLLEHGEVATNPDYVRVHKEWLWVPIYTADQMRAFAQEATRQAMEHGIAAIQALRDSHCAGTQGGEAVCMPDTITCDFVVAWNDAIEAIRSLLSDLDARGKK